MSIYCGNTKPNLNEYLEDFIFELYHIKSNAKYFSVIVKCFTCDYLGP